MSDYFQDAATSSDEPALFLHVGRDAPALELSAGLRFQPLVGQGLMLNLVTFAPHTEAPMHSHSEEQLVYVLDGQVHFTAGGVERVMEAGDAVLIPPFVPHAARTTDAPCVELDIFSPPRQALVDLLGTH